MVMPLYVLCFTILFFITNLLRLARLWLLQLCVL